MEDVIIDMCSVLPLLSVEERKQFAEHDLELFSLISKMDSIGQSKRIIELFIS